MSWDFKHPQVNPLSVSALNPTGNRTGNMGMNSLHFCGFLAACKSMGLYVYN